MSLISESTLPSTESETNMTGVGFTTAFYCFTMWKKTCHECQYSAALPLFVSYSIEFLPDIRTFHTGYKNMPDIKNHLQKTVLIYYCIFYAGYKNMFVYTISTVLTTY